MSEKSNKEQSSKKRESSETKRGLGNFLKKNWFTILVLLYLISPVDLIPEGLIPVAGQSDDALVALIELLRQWSSYKKKE
jgi:uncharacterized membrane protein YkvA (DUF1232 family)